MTYLLGPLADTCHVAIILAKKTVIHDIILIFIKIYLTLKIALKHTRITLNLTFC